MKKRVILIFLTLLFTILAFGKVDLYAETTDEGTNLEESALRVQASETNEELEEAPQKEIKEEVEENKEQTNTEEVPQREEKVEDKTENESGNETENKIETEIETENETEDQVKEKSQDQQTVSDAKENTVDQESKEEITKDQESEEKSKEEVEVEKETEVEEKAEVDEKNESEEKAEDSEETKEAENEEKTDEEVEKETNLEIGEEKIFEQLAEGGQAPDTLYINGEKGSDNNDGLSAEEAFKTFGHAKNSITDMIKNIVVTGTISVEGEVSLDGKNVKLIRSKDFNGYLLKVEEGKKATLKNIIIDGNSENNKNIEKSLVYVDGGTLNIEEGAILRNNDISPDPKLNPTHGGAIRAKDSTVNMTGGSIENNQATYGGGIQLDNSTMYFTGGAVQNNRSNLVYDKPYNQYYSAGAGIILRNGSELYMSGDAKVLNNFAAEIGGGISIGSNNPEKGSVLYMNGGIVDGNTAGSSGGGIFIQAKYYSGTQGKAYITAGMITNNKMDGSGVTNKAFGGAGIYVNGAKETIRYIDKNGKIQELTVYGANAELYIKNVLITDNKSEWEGAGYASCPIGKTTIYVNNGVAFNNNKAGMPGNDLYIYSKEYYDLHGGYAKYDLSKRMLGGGLFNWTTPDGKALADDKHKGTLLIAEGDEDAKLAVNSKPEDIELAKALAKVIISGNVSATRGGGIGSNGTVVFGTEDDKTEIDVEKRWDDNDNAYNKRPDTIEIQLLAKIGEEEYLVETKQVKAKEDWKAYFKDLPTLFEGANVSYTIKEKAVGGYNSEITGNPKDGFIITNKIIPPETPPEEPKTHIRVNKVWEALGETEAIRVQLYVNGEATNKFLTLSEENGWTATFYDLDIEDGFGNYYVYTVREVGDSNGIYKIGDREFEVSYAGNMDRGFTITNKEIPPEEPPEEPETPEPEEPEEPDEPEDEGGGRNIIPKTGVRTDIKSLYLSLIVLIALVILRKKKYS